MLELYKRYSVTIEETNIFAKGVCHLDGIVVFVDNAQAGDCCEIEITKLFKTYAFAKMLKLNKSDKPRLISPCATFDSCGGCDFMCIPFEEENRIKEEYVRATLKKQGIDANVREIVAPTSCEYRNKAVIFFSKNGYGFMKRGTNEIAYHENCCACPQVFNDIAKFTYNELKSTTIRALFLRKSNDGSEILVAPIFQNIPELIGYVSRLVSAFPSVRTVLTSRTEDKTPVLEKMHFKTVYGDGYIYDTVCGLNFRISPDAFYQINHPCAELLYEKVVELTEAKEITVCADLFCGTGTIGIITAKKTGAQVYGVEIVKSAAQDAQYNARLNKIKNASFEAMDAKDFDKKVDVCIIDPPRKGCHPMMIETLLRLEPKRIVYVSCNAETLSRDIKLLKEKYTLSSDVHPFNMFPRTSHVESVVCLTRRLDVDMHR